MYGYWYLMSLKYRYVITMLFSIEFNKVFILYFYIIIWLFHQCLEWSNSKDTWSPKTCKFIFWRCLRHLPQIRNAKYYCMVCDDQYYMYIFVHVVFLKKMCNIDYNHDNNNKKNILKQEHVLSSWTLPNVHVP